MPGLGGGGDEVEALVGSSWELSDCLGEYSCFECRICLNCARGMGLSGYMQRVRVREREIYVYRSASALGVKDSSSRRYDFQVEIHPKDFHCKV